MYYTSIGKCLSCEHYGVVFELSENIGINDNVILINYRHQLVLLSIKWDSVVDEDSIVDFILTMPGCSCIKNIDIGVISTQPSDNEVPCQLYIGTSLLVSVYDIYNSWFYTHNVHLTKPSVQAFGTDGKLYSFQDTLYEYSLRDINSIAPFISQVNRLLSSS